MIAPVEWVLFCLCLIGLGVFAWLSLHLSISWPKPEPVAVAEPAAEPEPTVEPEPESFSYFHERVSRVEGGRHKLTLSSGYCLPYNVWKAYYGGAMREGDSHDE